MGRRGTKQKQGTFAFRTWGGRRKGAGRKRNAERPMVAHRRRAAIKAKTPVHVTLRMRPEIARLRRRDQYRAIRQALGRTGHDDRCRIVHYSIQSNHIHLVCEPNGKKGLTSGMIAFKTSCARRLNALVARSGRVFADRYHTRILETPAQVRRALCYVLNNWLRHGEHRNHPTWTTDACSSAELFDGWNGTPMSCLPDDEPIPVAEPQFWLIRIGWKRHGLIGLREVPGPKS
jgi:REP element-mobilizing transposase RayT